MPGDGIRAEDLPYRPCVGIVLTNRAGLIWAGRRIDSPSPAWQMPQGGIDAGETPTVAALRELREETGIGTGHVVLVEKMKGWVTYDLPPDLLGKVWGGKYRGQKQKWLLYRFSGEDHMVRIDTDHPEFAEWGWKSADDLIAGIVPFKRAVYEQVLGAFRPHLA